MRVPTPIYHVTHVDNLPGLVASGGLYSHRRLSAGGIRYVDVAHVGVQARRERVQVPCGPGGGLHEYVPFYFAPRSPMLYVAHMGNMPGYRYSGGQEPLVYLVSTAQAVHAAGVGFVFTDGHAVAEVSCFYDDLARLDAVDWDIMRERYWTDTRTDGDRKRRREAEFLVYDSVPWALVNEVVAMTEATRERAASVLTSGPHRPPVRLRREWYY
jgi:hypothetical protein